MVVCLDVNGFDERREINIGEKVEYVLELVNDLMVDRQLLIHHFLEIILDVLETRNQTLRRGKKRDLNGKSRKNSCSRSYSMTIFHVFQYLQSHQLICDSLTEGADCDVPDVTQEMLHANLGQKTLALRR